jgi:hypothetical protein
MSLLTRIGKIAIATIVSLIVVDIVGVVVSFVFDIFSFQDESKADAGSYVLWFVIGVFGGMLIRQLATVVSLPDVRGTGMDQAETAGSRMVVTATTLTVLAMLLALGFRYLGPGDSSPYVPDNEWLTVTLFTGLTTAIVFAHRLAADSPRHLLLPGRGAVDKRSGPR